MSRFRPDGLVSEVARNNALFGARIASLPLLINPRHDPAVARYGRHGPARRSRAGDLLVRRAEPAAFFLIPLLLRRGVALLRRKQRNRPRSPRPGRPSNGLTGCFRAVRGRNFCGVGASIGAPRRKAQKIASPNDSLQYSYGSPPPPPSFRSSQPIGAIGSVSTISPAAAAGASGGRRMSAFAAASGACRLLSTRGSGSTWSRPCGSALTRARQ